MLVVLTVFAIAAAWVGYQLNWIRERHEILNRASPTTPRLGATAPASLRIFGEPGYRLLEVVIGVSERIRSLDADEKRQLRRIALLFPEARVYGSVYVFESGEYCLMDAQGNP
jgi:hypothetical protein